MKARVGILEPLQSSMPISHVIGFDDCPFTREHRGDVRVIGTVFSGTQLEGVLSTSVRKDGANSTTQLIRLVAASKFHSQLQLLMLQGVALAGFNVIDAHKLSDKLEVPVLIVARRQPGLTGIRAALLERIPGGKRKWALIERLGKMEACENVFVQRVGISLEDAGSVIRRTTVQGNIPEPLRAAHLIAGGITTGQSRGRT
jgi:uncharacterized protein